MKYTQFYISRITARSERQFIKQTKKEALDKYNELVNNSKTSPRRIDIILSGYIEKTDEMRILDEYHNYK